ncbi:ubiquitin-like modifier-activating enzyme ATG7, partial [Tremellales sp. Uapishka_1]
MPPLQFQPLSSQPTPAFWSAVNTLKLDKLKLDDTVQPLKGWIEAGRSVRDREGREGEEVGVDGSLGVGGGAFGGDERSPPGTMEVAGLFKNFNTIEEFRETEGKKTLFNDVVRQIVDSFGTDSPRFNTFLLVTFADLKKYTYNYWFAFPALLSKPSWEAGDFVPADEEEVDEIRRLVESESAEEGYCLKGPAGQRVVGRLSKAREFFAGVPEDERIIVFHDPSALPSNPGWTLRNILYYLSHHQAIRSLTVICLRQSGSRKGRVYLPPTEEVPAEGSVGLPQAVGWERNRMGKLTSRMADLGPMMDPAKLADQAVDLNLKLMRWRIMPSLQLEKIASTKCLLLGAGTLGCYVSRALMGWGIRNITFVDNAKVSFSNPVRQPLFDFEDCLEGGKPKAQCAADRLTKIFPGVNARAHAFMIPMPGHPVSPASEASVQADVEKLESLIKDHDVVFLLMDSRESRWLPTVMAASMNKIVINAALGFDSYLVMRHGGEHAGKRELGCYYCNDIVAPTDSLTDRTLDQMCTVTRPGIAPIAAASAVELLVSLIQHPLGINAPAETSTSSSAEAESSSPLGLVPHQLRGQLSQWKTLLIEGAAYEKCTACSNTVIEAYRSGGFELLLRVFNENDFLEKLTGLDKLHEESEALMESLDWEEGSEGSF